MWATLPSSRSCTSVPTDSSSGTSGSGRWQSDGRPEHLRAACESSLARLGTEQIPLYQLHRPDPAVPIEDSVGELVALRDEGKIRHIGLSNVDARQLEQALALTPIASVQNRYNPSDRSSEPLVELAETHGFAFIPWAPVGGHQPGEGEGLATVAKHRGVLPVQVAIAWLLARSPQMLPIPGTSSVAHLEENVAAAALGLSEDELAALG